MAATFSSNAEEHFPEVPGPGDVIAGKYRIEGVVGTGGMGTVLSARHQQLGQAVAIKVLRLNPEDERRAEAISRFLREGQAAAALESDHVVRIYDVGTLESGLPYMVMELLKGADLASVLHAGLIPIPTAVEYVLQACDAIAKAHAQGIVHRDLKPSNLFATQRSDGTALIKVLDFGISKSTRPQPGFEGDLTATRTVLGSPFYMSPEQVRDARKVDHRTDIWSLGAILHELITRTPPFEGDTLPGICAAIVADPPPSLRKLRPEAPPELEALILRCLAKDPNKRIQFVEDLMMALLPFSERTNIKVPSRIEINSTPLPLFERLAVPSAPTVALQGAASPAMNRDSTLPSQDLIQAGAAPGSGKRIHINTHDAVAVEKLPVPKEKPPRGATLFVGASLLVALAAAAYGILGGSAPAEPPSAKPVTAASPPPAPAEPMLEPPKVESAPEPQPAPVPSAAPSTQPKAVQAKAAKLKPRPAAPPAPAAAQKPPSETDIRLER